MQLLNPQKELRKPATYQTEMLWREPSLLEERHGDFTRDDTEVSRIRGLKKLIEDSSFLGREVQIGLS